MTEGKDKEIYQNLKQKDKMGEYDKKWVRKYGWQAQKIQELFKSSKNKENQGKLTGRKKALKKDNIPELKHTHWGFHIENAIWVTSTKSKDPYLEIFW